MLFDSTVSLLAPNMASAQRSSASPSLSALANKQASSKLGIVDGKLPGSYSAVYDQQSRQVTEQVTEDRAVTRTDATYANRDITEQRDVYEDRAIYENRAVFEDQAVYETQGVFEDRAVYEEQGVFEDQAIMGTRDVYETRAVYEDRNIMATRVNGTRALNTFNSTSQAGIDIGADFSVQVGSGPAAVLRFDTGSRVSLTMNGTTTRFSYNSFGSVGAAVAAALNNVDGMHATLSADGKLRLETTDAKSVKIAEVANGLLDLSGSPLAKLGLEAGITNAGVVGTERVQTGTQQVVVGTEQYQTGTQRVQTGTQQVQVGTERVQTGTQQVQIGTQRVQTGSEQVQTGTEQILIGTQSFVVGTERYQTGSVTHVVGKETVVTGTRTRTETGPRTLVGLQVSDDFGIGELLSQLQEGALPEGYIEALFGTLDPADLPARDGFAGAAYRETRTLGQRDDADAPKRFSVVARNDVPKAETRTPALASGE